jgi:hypothetical protein
MEDDNVGFGATQKRGRDLREAYAPAAHSHFVK